jgi:hypothetical protein
MGQGKTNPWSALSAQMTACAERRPRLIPDWKYQLEKKKGLQRFSLQALEISGGP